AQFDRTPEGDLTHNVIPCFSPRPKRTTPATGRLSSSALRKPEFPDGPLGQIQSRPVCSEFASGEPVTRSISPVYACNAFHVQPVGRCKFPLPHCLRFLAISLWRYNAKRRSTQALSLQLRQKALLCGSVTTFVEFQSHVVNPV